MRVLRRGTAQCVDIPPLALVASPSTSQYGCAAPAALMRATAAQADDPHDSDCGSVSPACAKEV